eukprot:IDg9649t1
MSRAHERRRESVVVAVASALCALEPARCTRWCKCHDKAGRACVVRTCAVKGIFTGALFTLMRCFPERMRALFVPVRALMHCAEGSRCVFVGCGDGGAIYAGAGDAFLGRRGALFSWAAFSIRMHCATGCGCVLRTGAVAGALTITAKAPFR